MQCEIRALSERRENGRKRVSDTLPKPGRVNEVCKEWLVKEDGALAYQLQQKEVQEHLSGNRSRNAIVREDFPKALDEQKREEEEAMARYLETVRMQEERDARLAKEFAQRIALEEEEKQRRRLHEDEAIASQIQEKEIQRTKDVKPARHLSAAGGSCSSQIGAVGDVNSVGLPMLPVQLPQTASAHAHAHKIHHHHHHHQHLQELTKQFRATNVDDPDEPDLTDLEFQEEMQRQLQEKKDEELAKRLQQQEEEMDSLGMVDKDRLLAIEAQDKELARLLQDRERAKARRARERAKQRALLKKQQQQQETEREVGGAGESVTERTAARPNNLDVIRINKPKMPEPEELERVMGAAATSCVGVGGGVNTLPPNIAMAIDPTYTPHSPQGGGGGGGATTSTCSSTISSPAYSLPTPDFEEDDDSPVPPYMPIQGQRRTSSLEKKHKKNKKDSCKQQ